MRHWKQLESEVRSYSRSFPVTFTEASGAILKDSEGNTYIDFLAGAGSLNYGHNNPQLKGRLIDYIQNDGLTHGLDMTSEAKVEFMKAFERYILEPRHLDYKVQFTGPTGTNAVEAALKIGRKVTGRSRIVAFTNGFHGVTLGALAATANNHYRQGAGVDLGQVTHIPYDGFTDGVYAPEYLTQLLTDQGSGLGLPAAVIVETVQGEGGINVASTRWLQDLQAVCEKFDILFIVDDIQMGCGRTGTFFSFEEADIYPDIVTLSKSLSGYGLPFSLTLMKPEYDLWQPGEHNGTFRGNNLAFVTATAALEEYWKSGLFACQVQDLGDRLKAGLQRIESRLEEGSVEVRGKGMVMGIDCGTGENASAVCEKAFERGLVIETSGSKNQVVKTLPPLTISEAELDRGLEILEESFVAALAPDEELVNAMTKAKENN